MNFSVSIGDVAVIIAGIVFIIRLESHIKILQLKLTLLEKTVNNLHYDHITPLNVKIGDHRKQLESHDERINKLEVGAIGSTHKKDPHLELPTADLRRKENDRKNK